MPTLYDEHETVIYPGRGKYSRNAKAKIAERAAYVRNDEGQLVVYVPESPHTLVPSEHPPSKMMHALSSAEPNALVADSAFTLTSLKSVSKPMRANWSPTCVN